MTDRNAAEAQPYSYPARLWRPMLGKSLLVPIDLFMFVLFAAALVRAGPLPAPLRHPRFICYSRL